MINIAEIYESHCNAYGIPFTKEKSVLSYDNTTLFCPAGMQKYKKLFSDTVICTTVANIQPCIRLNDFDQLGDGTHLACFNMLGLFSFRDWTVVAAKDFWLEFLEKKLNISISYVTIHPDKPDWEKYYPDHTVRFDPECMWTDGNIGGYCTEFYVNYKGEDIEVGNIVNPLDTCIDFGGGLERLDMIVNHISPKNQLECLVDAANAIIISGVIPSNVKQGYVLRKILREIHKLHGFMDNRFFEEEIKRQQVIFEKYERLKHKHVDKSKHWWMDTHGVDIDLLGL